MAHLIVASARKAATAEIPVSADEVTSVRTEKGEQLLRKNRPQVEWNHPGIALLRGGNEPSCPIDLRMEIGVVRRFDGQFPVDRRDGAHYVEPLAARTGQQPKARVEAVERQNSVRLQMADGG